MTTFQDPPPHSRRAVRQSEREGSAPEPTATAPQAIPYNFGEDSGAASVPAAPPQSGRRAQGRVAPPTDGVTSQPLSHQPPPGVPRR